MKLFEITIRADMPRHIEATDREIEDLVELVETDSDLALRVQGVRDRLKFLIPAKFEAVIMDNL